jgi:DNA repair exonuclease SbcCD nuclease subunit
MKTERDRHGATAPAPARGGLLVIGDPHLEGRVPNFRKDDFPRVVLGKLGWALDYARRHRLLPAILGDLFHVPRDNPNWLIVELLQLFDQEILAIYGNHDVRENRLTEHDSFSILVRAGRLRLLDGQDWWQGQLGGREVVIAGSSWGTPIEPESLQAVRQLKSSAEPPLVVWLLHENAIDSPHRADWRISFQQFPADLVINGHIHTRREPERIGQTTWLTPGNITRRTRSDASREHVPAVLRIDLTSGGWTAEHVTVPHAPFVEVFHPQVIDRADSAAPSSFVAGLAELQARRTESGAGLLQFLDANLDQFNPDVCQEIRRLAQEVLAS